MTSVVLTCTVMPVESELLRTNTGCAGPSFSLTVYVDWLNVTRTVVLVEATSVTNMIQ